MTDTEKLLLQRISEARKDLPDRYTDAEHDHILRDEIALEIIRLHVSPMVADALEEWEKDVGFWYA